MSLNFEKYRNGFTKEEYFELMELIKITDTEEPETETSEPVICEEIWFEFDEETQRYEPSKTRPNRKWVK